MWKSGIKNYMTCLYAFSSTCLVHTSKPLGDAIRHRRGGDLVVLQRPPPIHQYQQNNAEVDSSKQYRSKNPVWRHLKTFWKYFMSFIFEICIMNSFLLWLNTPGIAKPIKHYSLIDFSLDIAQCLIGDFSCRKRLRKVQPHGPSVSRAGISRHINVKLVGKNRRCRWCSSHGQRYETILGCNICNISLCRGACFQMYHIHHQLRTCLRFTWFCVITVLSLYSVILLCIHCMYM